ncbi:hypothetical protein [uncultured Algibacter sp.]|uniref:hypothetical protein n=1 Tax=uncultured Algibacter sp. TaxID=298659 RepID=UPI002622259B|nr:hypothetical protein [uncultured Algibacter sp.]
MVWDINGKFKYSVPTDEQRIVDVKWKNQKPYANNIEDVETDYPVKVYLKTNNNKLELIALNNNRFALIDTLGNLIRGDKKDFVRVIDDGNGFTKIEQLNVEH